jgi:hypothetical protein
MSSRSLALTAAVLLVVGFGGGYLMGSPRTYSRTVKGLLVQDGPMIHLENRTGKDPYLIIMVPKAGSGRPPVVAAKGRSVDIRKDTLRWLGVYRLERAAYLDINDIIKPCMGSSCTPGTPIPPPPPPQFVQFVPGGDITPLPQFTPVIQPARQ